MGHGLLPSPGRSVSLFIGCRAGHGRRTSCDARGGGFSPHIVHLTVHALNPRYGASRRVAPSMSKAPATGGGRRSGAARPGRPSGRPGNAGGAAPVPSPAGPLAFYLPFPSGCRRRKTGRFALAGESAKKISGTIPNSSLRARGVGLSTPRAQLCHRPGTPVAIGFLARSRTSVLVTGSRKIRGRIKGAN